LVKAGLTEITKQERTAAMDKLRRMARNPRDLLARLSFARGLALILVVVLPGGLFVPLCVGIYGAIRHSLSGKAATRGTESAVANPLPDESRQQAQ
jgi:hypothetical protein